MPVMEGSREASRPVRTVGIARSGNANAPVVGITDLRARRADPRRLVGRVALFERLRRAGRITLVAAPAGSGKSLLLRSWVREAGLSGRVAWVSVERGERDEQRFWLSVLDGFKATGVGSALVRPRTAALDLDGWGIVERLLEDLEPLAAPLWLVIDDLHELRGTETVRQLDRLLTRAPVALRVVLATRHQPRLSLCRMRLDGELTEIRAPDLRFTRDEARALIEGSGVRLSDAALGLLCERTEGWAAGLRLAALSLVGHPDPERFAVEFAGSERTVSEYLMTEVLERQPEQVRRLLLRTSILDRVNGALADRLTGSAGSEGTLHALEDANAFVVSLDAPRTWFRYHRLFTELLALELRRTAPSEIAGLHCAAAEWFAEHGRPVEAIRHAQAAANWRLAARVLFDHWFSLGPNGQADAACELLSGFPEHVVAADPELTTLQAAYELNRGSVAAAEPHLARGTDGLASLPAERVGHLQATLAILRLTLAGRRGDADAAVEEAQRLLYSPEGRCVDRLRPAEELRAAALISFGTAESESVRIEDAERHLGQGVGLARRLQHPYLEVTGLAHWANAGIRRSLAVAAERGMRAIELAREHGWGEDPSVAPAYVAVGAARLAQGRLEEAQSWLERAGRAVRAKAYPVVGMSLHCLRGFLELGRGRNEEALGALSEGQQLAGLIGQLPIVTQTNACAFLARVRLGELDGVERDLGELDAAQQETADMRCVLAVLRLAQDLPEAATDALAPVLVRPSVPPGRPICTLLLEAIARDALGETGSAARALESALDLAAPESEVFAFLLHPAPKLLQRHRRGGTVHAALISEIHSRLAARAPGSPQPGVAEPLREPLSQSELRILRYLPARLSVQEIADELFLSVNTVKTHIRHLYAKLDVCQRKQAVVRARALGLLPSPLLGH